MSYVKLKPCPFCGDDAVATETNYETEKVLCRCLACSAEGPSVDEANSNAKRDARELWNTRDEAAEAIAARVKRLEDRIGRSADGVCLIDCEEMYCPKCGERVEEGLDYAKCWKCVNPDGGANPPEPPLPLLFENCLSKPMGGKL